jgi:hypothetical protein
LKLSKPVIFLVVFLLVVDAGWIWHNFKPTPIKNLAKDIDKAVEQVHQSGMDQEVEFVLPDASAILLISPPYASLKELENKFPASLLKKIDHDLYAVETGQIFYIRNNRIADHKFLSNFAAPVLGVSQEARVKLLISKKTTSGRPVRVEILS